MTNWKIIGFIVILSMLIEHTYSMERQLSTPPTALPKDDLILFTVENTTPELMPVHLDMSASDRYCHPLQLMEIGSLRKVVQPNSNLTVMASECWFLKWITKAYASNDDLPFEWDIRISVSFNDKNDYNNAAPYHKSHSLYFGFFFGRDKIFPFGAKFIVSEYQYISKLNQDVRSFRVHLEQCSDS
jgi:hypothetical protein